MKEIQEENIPKIDEYKLYFDMYDDIDTQDLMIHMRLLGINY